MSPGDDAFRDLTDPYRRELLVHCYRILGSVQDAEDVLQESLLAAWRGLDAFEGRASVRAWLYRIATNRCLNVLRDRSRRPREVAPMPESPAPAGEPYWIEPFPDTLLEGIADAAPGPEARYEARESIALAFLSGLQQLPPRQRAVLVLRDVLGFRSAEVADMLRTTETAVKGALQRARETLRGRDRPPDRDRAPLPGSGRERTVVAHFAQAVESGDVESLVTLLTTDASVTMPPHPFEYRGHEAIATFLRDRADLRGHPPRLAPTRANGQPAFGCYLPAGAPPIARPYALWVLTLTGDRIAGITWFFDTSLFSRFGVPRTLPAA